MSDFAAKLGIDCTDIDAVVAAVDDWCEKHDGRLSLDREDDGKYSASVLWGHSIESCIDEDLCAAILSACEKAALKIPPAEAPTAR